MICAYPHSILFNGRWRMCFVWTGCDADNIEIVDYH
jgi:proteic killer suppression protein